MSSYKVSYKTLRDQGEQMKAIAQSLDEIVGIVQGTMGRFGQHEALVPIQANLRKWCDQVEESRTILNTAGAFVGKSVETYTQVEVTYVKVVDSSAAHQRDFYGNPVVVPSAGEGAGIQTGTTRPANPENTAASTSGISEIAAEVRENMEIASQGAASSQSAAGAEMSAPSTIEPQRPNVILNQETMAAGVASGAADAAVQAAAGAATSAALSGAAAAGGLGSSAMGMAALGAGGVAAGALGAAGILVGKAAKNKKETLGNDSNESDLEAIEEQMRTAQMRLKEMEDQPTETAASDNTKKMFD